MGKTTHRIRLAVSAGDPFGIGPEVIRTAQVPDDVTITVFGPHDRLAGVERVVDISVRGDPTSGPSALGGDASRRALDAALDSIRVGDHDALVTGPISKESWALSGAAADGHTPYLGEFFDVSPPLMVFAWDRAEPVVALLTTHIPLRAVPSTLTSAKVEAAVRTLQAGLQVDFGVLKPRIGVCGLNPHAGEAGLLGTEEIDFVAPALARLKEDGLLVFGPLPGDTAFAHRDRYDAILALYHDQGLGPVKALAFQTAVNITLGLPCVRTSPAHGTAFEIAGRGQADPTSMSAALAWAADLARRRAGRAGPSPASLGTAG